MFKRRSQFLINKRFQLRFCFYVTSWIVALTLVYPLVIHNLYDSFIEIAKDTGNYEIVDSLKVKRAEVTNVLIWIQVFLIGVMVILSVYVSHRIAGPLYKLGLYFAAGKEGNFLRGLTFRKSDHFKEVAVAYNGMMDALADRLESEQKRIDGAIAKIEKGDKAEAISELKVVRDNLNVGE